MDSICSSHICPPRDTFSTYESLYGGSVSLRNNVECKTIKNGLIQIKVHDRSVKTLTDVHHVLELKKSIISFGILDSIGTRIATQGGVIEVSKISQIMMIGKILTFTYFKATQFLVQYMNHLRESRNQV